MHIFYILSKYHVLNILVSKHLQKYKLYNDYKKYTNNFIVHFLADALLHWTPAYLAYLYINPDHTYKYKNYISHVSYPYLLIKSFDANKLYDVNMAIKFWMVRNFYCILFYN